MNNKIYYNKILLNKFITESYDFKLRSPPVTTFTMSNSDLRFTARHTKLSKDILLPNCIQGFKLMVSLVRLIYQEWLTYTSNQNDPLSCWMKYEKVGTRTLGIGNIMLKDNKKKANRRLLVQTQQRKHQNNV